VVKVIRRFRGGKAKASETNDADVANVWGQE